MLICILTKNVITSCSVTMMLFLHLEVKPLMTLTTVLYLSCALISGHLAMMLTIVLYASSVRRSDHHGNVLVQLSNSPLVVDREMITRAIGNTISVSFDGSVNSSSGRSATLRPIIPRSTTTAYCVMTYAV